MHKGKLLFIFFAIGLGLSSYAQDCSELKNEAPNNRKELVSTSSEKLQTRSAQAVDEAEESMKKDLLVKLSEKILIDVENTSVNFVQDDGSAITQLFTSETKINSNTRLGNLRFEFCFDNKHKTLFGRCRLDKTGLAESIAKDCTTRLIALNAEISGVVKSGNSSNVRPLVRKYEAITRDFQSALFINYEITTNEWNQHVADYNKTISSIANSDENLNLKSSLDHVYDLMTADDFEEAISILKNLRNRYKSNDDVEHTLEQCYDRYLTHVRLLAAKLIQQHDYPSALELIDNYCASARCGADAKELRNELRRGYFDESEEKLIAYIRAKQDDMAATVYATLSGLSDVRTNKFKDLSARYQQYKIDRMIEKARIENDKRNYWEAYSLLRATELTYGFNDGELSSLKESIFRKIAAQEVREEKKTRPHLHSFRMGPEVLSNEVDLSKAGSSKLNYMHLAFGAGVYFKYNFGPDNVRKGYPVRSDVVGIKARFIDLPSYVLLDNTSDDRLIPKTGHILELGGDGVLMRIFHYNVSAVYNQDSHADSPLGVSASFGVRIPIARVSIGVDGRYYNQFNAYTAINAAAYLQGNFDFNRKFNRADKRKVRARLKDY